MPKSNSHNREEAISKALEDLSTGKYPTVTAAARAYALPQSTLAHLFYFDICNCLVDVAAQRGQLIHI